ncbi:MAG TPA: hypothetical protein VK076_07245 [Candidatus Sphingobacterium stercoripullorum]|nr:hypothetical protein [Candidatus Sphingobacterium stercoripullorum]
MKLEQLKPYQAPSFKVVEVLMDQSIAANSSDINPGGEGNPNTPDWDDWEDGGEGDGMDFDI